MKIHQRGSFLFFILAVLVGNASVRAEIPDRVPSSGPEFQVTEKSLVDLIGPQTPSLQKLRSTLASRQIAGASYDEQFRSELYLSGSQARTREKPLIQFAPVFSPTRSLEMGFRKKTPLGVSVDGSFGFAQQTAGGLFDLNNATTVILGMDLSFDLWKDVLGRSSRAQLKAHEAGDERARLEDQIERKVFFTSIRGLYWRLVANERSRKIQEELLKTAEVQARDAKKRLANSVSDRGEVARYESQVAARQASLEFLNYERDALYTQLRELLPELNQKTLVLSAYDLDQATAEVTVCIEKIATEKEVPLHATLYDEVIEQIQTEKTNQLQANKTLDDIDLKLTTGVRTTGVDNDNPGTFGGATDDFKDNNRLGWEIGLALTIPLDSKSGRIAQLKSVQSELQGDAEIQEIRARLESAHKQLISSFIYLNQVVKYQKSNSSNLRIRVQDMKRKFSQARVSVSDLVTDQEALLNADLSVISTEIEVLSVLFSYLSIFTETQCDFYNNVLKGARS